LLGTGVLDSLNLVRLVAHIEEQFGLELPVNEVGLESFRSVAALAELVLRRGMPAAHVSGDSGGREALAAEIKRLLETMLSIRVEDTGTDLFRAGYLDSMSLVQLILELEGHFDLALPIQDLDIVEFHSIASMTDLIERRKRMTAV